MFNKRGLNYFKIQCHILCGSKQLTVARAVIYRQDKVPSRPAPKNTGLAVQNNGSKLSKPPRLANNITAVESWG